MTALHYWPMMLLHSHKSPRSPVVYRQSVLFNWVVYRSALMVFLRSVSLLCIPARWNNNFVFILLFNLTFSLLDKALLHKFVPR